ncbi:MAG: hypothetical protein HY223_06390 [Thaumarchaeota archaeon]|nr:hypothetical protein [Nitrososphaerota archaeon]
MTLIIGFKCLEGVCLVSDTKVMDIDSGESSYQSKILTPIMGLPFMVGAAGYTHLFREFNRKLPEKVQESASHIRILNVTELMKTGLSRSDAIKYLYSKELQTTQLQQQEMEEKKPDEDFVKPDIADIDLTHIYTAEKFIDDCKNLVKGISSNFEQETDPIEVLIGLKRPNYPQAELHYVDSKGNEVESDDFLAIGSGSPYVKTFFDRVYLPNKNMFELITHAFRIITFTEMIAKESSVGYTSEKPPEALAVLNDGRFGRVYFKNDQKIIQEMKKEMHDYESLIKKDTPILEWDPKEPS